MGIAERKQREKEARLALIRDVAAGLFQKKGFEATTMDEIAELCELSKPSIYALFKGKDDLFYSIVEPTLSKIGKRIEKIADNENESVIKTIKDLVREVYKHYDRNPDVFQMLMQKTNIKTLSPNKLEHLEDIIRSNRQQMERVIRRGIDQGVFRRLDPKLASIVIWDSFMGVFHSQAKRMEGGRSDYRKSTVMAALDFLLEGFQKK
jgi:AcrR family transcriptional regulator